MKTKDRIVHLSLELFNQQGERKITTNHIAAELGISPGNLYYHFDNKQEIIASIFSLYEQQLKDSFRPQADQLLSLDSVMEYLDASFTLMWRFRFLYANLVELLANDAKLAARYYQVQEELVDWVRSILIQLRQSRFIQGDDATLFELADMVRFIIGAWIAYQSAQQPGELEKGVLYQGVLKVLLLIKPYFTAESMANYQRLENHYRQLALKN